MHWKQLIKSIMIERQRRNYFQRLEKKAVSYDAWIKKQESTMVEDLSGQSVLPEKGEEVVSRIQYVSFEAAGKYWTGKSMPIKKAEEPALQTADCVILFYAPDGKIAENTAALTEYFFRKHPHVTIAYGDEDVMGPEGDRYTPWFKPDWSPDTFLSYFYFGSIVAVKESALDELTDEDRKYIRNGKETEQIYRMCFLLAWKAGGFCKRETGELFDFPVGHIDEILFHSSFNKEMNVASEIKRTFSGMGTGTYLNAPDIADLYASIIIPSKDNAEVLKRCIESVENTTKIPHEIIVVDNGSNDETRKKLERYLAGIGAVYLYEKAEFNFSAMCNAGARKAGGTVYVFINDDVEIKAEETEKDWLFELCTAALQPYTGAAGAKLIYPSSRKIQHAGIVNLRLGPVHKLQFKNDNICYYYGWNRGIHNVIAVTGACMAIERGKYEEAGGFSEELPVAFNDVDICFSLYEKGYYNTVLQDTVLYHHESLSRGTDEEEEKLSRLLEEKRKLYTRHRNLYGKDPFYHKYLASDILSSDFGMRADYETEAASCPMSGRAGGLLSKAKEDACVYISIEFAGAMQEWKEGTEAENTDGGMEYYVQGYCFVAGSDNAVYEKILLLKNEEEVYAVCPADMIRRDVEENLPDQVNAAMTGFAAEINAKDIPLGNYRLGILMKDKCSRQMLYSWTNRRLDVN